MADQFDVIIVGAGISGLYQLHRARQLGLSVRVFEAGDDVGGTWYWNRYPGARFDSESYSYGYSFSEEILNEWEWSEHFSAQPETLAYVNFVADKLDLRRDIEFGKRVTAAQWNDERHVWIIELDDGRKASAQFLITAIGILSEPTLPNIEGLSSFEGDAFHTARWPEGFDYAGKRVAVIGTGATGVQVIQEVAKTAANLCVFQRSPNYCAPLHNAPIDAATQQTIKSNYADIFATCRQSHGGFIHDSDPRNALEVSEEERLAFFEQRYSEPGFGIWMGNFRDIFVDADANATISEFIADKIRSRVNDPTIAEKLIPTNHGFGMRRVPLETHYYEAYNQDNVRLIDIRETPIQRITPTGVKTSTEQLDFDIIVYATGFNAVLGAFEQIDFRGVGGLSLRDKWVDGPKTYLGLQVNGFPNLLTLVGPHNAATFCNIPRCIEQNVEWVTDLLRFMKDHGHTRVEALADAELEWTEHVYQLADRMLFSKTDSWFMGINSNLAGRDKRTFMLYSGGAPAYRERCDAVAADNYHGFDLQ